VEQGQLKSSWESYKFPIILLGAIVIGCILGLILGEDADVLKPLGDIFINLMFTIVVPLVFLTISSAVASMASLHRLGKIMGALLAVLLLQG